MWNNAHVNYERAGRNGFDAGKGADLIAVGPDFGTGVAELGARAGIVAGDVIIKLGENSFSDINSYMNVLSKYKKGDATTVTIKRGSQELTFNIIF